MMPCHEDSLRRALHVRRAAARPTWKLVPHQPVSLPAKLQPEVRLAQAQVVIGCRSTGGACKDTVCTGRFTGTGTESSLLRFKT